MRLDGRECSWRRALRVARTVATAASVGTSQERTPNRMSRISAAAATGPSRPSTTPTIVRRPASPRISAMHRPALGAERHADADLPGPLAHRIRDDAIETNHAEQPRDRREAAYQRRRRPPQVGGRRRVDRARHRRAEERRRRPDRSDGSPPSTSAASPRPTAPSSRRARTRWWDPARRPRTWSGRCRRPADLP